MRYTLPSALLVATACGPTAGPATDPVPLLLPATVTVQDTRTGQEIAPAQLLARLRSADFVLLGELHDNRTHHQVRGLLLGAAGSRPAVVFEQFAAAEGPIPLPDATPMEQWLDQHGFDRTAWRWPLHQPVVRAAITHARELRGSNVTRETLRAVVRNGVAEAPDAFRELVETIPMDSGARAALDQELIDGHCGQLPEAMIPGLRAAQEVRDAAMARALLAALPGGSAWLIAGNGHVRADLAVPRMLRAKAPDARVVVVGLVERPADGPPRLDPDRYDIAIITPAAQRADPCAAFRRP